MDRPLLKLERDIESLLRQLEDTRDEREIERIGHALGALDHRISNTPATSPIGLRVKIRRLWHGLSNGSAEQYLPCYQSISRDLDHLEAIWPPDVLQLSD